MVDYVAQEKMHMEFQDKGSADRRKLIDDVMASSSKQSSKPSVMDIGQVYIMTLPDDYVAGPSQSGTTGNGMFREYHSSKDSDVKIYFEYRGRRMSNEGASEFKDLLSQPAHLLKQNEIDKIGEALRDKSNTNDFRVLSAKTQDINGKRVLIVEGQYLKHGLTARTMYVDADGTGSAVQEITFQAPTDRVTKHLVNGIKSQESIIWK